MKKFFAFAAVAVMMMSAMTLNAQNKFKGIVKYSITSVGSNPVEIPEQYATPQLKVMNDQIVAEDVALLGFSPFTKKHIQKGRTESYFFDFSPVMMYLAQADVTLSSYSGDGKILMKEERTQSEIDSLTIPCTEGFYIEYVAGETKKIAGMTAKLARIHVFDEEGTDHPTSIWYSDEMGPDVNFIQNGIKGVALEYEVRLGEGSVLRFAATEIIKGKVKDTDFLNLSGYELMDSKKFAEFTTEFSEELRFLQGGDED